MPGNSGSNSCVAVAGVKSTPNSCSWRGLPASAFLSTLAENESPTLWRVVRSPSVAASSDRYRWFQRSEDVGWGSPDRVRTDRCLEVAGLRDRALRVCHRRTRSRVVLMAYQVAQPESQNRCRTFEWYRITPPQESYPLCFARGRLSNPHVSRLAYTRGTSRGSVRTWAEVSPVVRGSAISLFDVVSEV